MRFRRQNEALIRIGEAIQPCLKILGLETKLKEAKLLQLWEEVVGPQVAPYAQADEYKGGTLFVKVANPIWLQQLSFFTETFISKLNDRIGEPLVEKIFFRCGRVDYQPPPTEEEPLSPPFLQESLTPEETREIEGQVRMIRDRELQALLQRLLVKARLYEKYRYGDKAL
ncbi:MAG: DUF721 domain-containing protein [Nitrospinota bacterium]|nr:MAG: DUF721 domain-containing protein [Nitrospinota bacterium]